ncbi:hypothetical protein AEMCBJ_26190 [Cupriavidus necator]
MIKVPAKFSAVVALACLLASNAEATENGQTSYPVGVNTVLNGILPPPGETQFYNYTLYYHAGKFAGPHGESLLPGFQLNAFIDDHARRDQFTEFSDSISLWRGCRT